MNPNADAADLAQRFRELTDDELLALCRAHGKSMGSDSIDPGPSGFAPLSEDGLILSDSA